MARIDNAYAYYISTYDPEKRFHVMIHTRKVN